MGRWSGGTENERIGGAGELSAEERGETSPVAGGGRLDLWGSGLQND